MLARRERGEADRTLTLFTRPFGKLEALARGARRSQRRFAGCLDLFSRIEVLLEEDGRGRVALLEATLQDGREGIRRELLSLAQAGYLCDLVDALAQERDPSPPLYDLLSGTLDRLERRPLRALELRAFELALLGRLGFAPALERCVNCQALPARAVAFDPDRGGILCGTCARGPRARPIPPEVLRLLRVLAAGALPEGASPATQGRLRALLAWLIDERLPRPLPSRKFLEQVARSGRQGEAVPPVGESGAVPGFRSGR